MKKINRKKAEELFYKNIQIYHSNDGIEFIKLNNLRWYYSRFTENSFIRECKRFRDQYQLSRIKYYYK